jgi:primary-amine oxidase
VPYAQPDENWAWRFARDIGEYGCGRNANALVPGVDVPPNATFLDAVLADDVGQTIDYPSTVALYERHGTLLWKRVDPESGEQDARLARELVIAADCGIGNYVYGLRWIFHQDGTLEAQVDLTGTLLLQGVASPEEGERHGTAVADHIIAPSHQHFFSFRLDFDVDGSTNRVSEVNTHPLPIGPENPYGNAFAATTQLLPSELEAQRDLNFQTDRTWKVTNPSVLNTLGHPVGYTLQPGDSTRPYISPQYPGRQHTGFIEHQLWVTAYDPNQMYAAGPYPNQSQRDEGLPQWIVDDANIVDTDIVLWHTIGATHHPEVEEYPVMPVQHIGFRLTPDGFFGKNPALNIPPRP